MDTEEAYSQVVTRLRSVNAKERDLAASELTDWLEEGSLPNEIFTMLVSELLQAASKEKDSVVKESIYNALSSASMSSRSSLVNWNPVVEAMPTLNRACLEHALVILGFVGRPEFQAAIMPYIEHADERIRRSAEEALEENKARTSN